MAIALKEFKAEKPVAEERLARLEQKTDHIQSDLTEMKADIRRLDTKLDAVREAVAGLQQSRFADRVWWLLIAGTLLGVMARGFKWI